MIPCVVSGKLADGAVLTAHYAAGSVDAAALADDSVREDGVIISACHRHST